LNLGLLSKLADLKPGQKVFSSGVGGVFPSGILIGEVKKFEVLPLEGTRASSRRWTSPPSRTFSS